MPGFDTDQWAVVLLVLFIGWLLGLLSRSGGGKWRRAYDAERAAHAAYRTETDTQLAAANARVAELERAAPVTAPFAGSSDDLSRIRGVGPAGQTRLNEMGLHSYRDVAAMSAADEAALEGRMGAEPGVIAGERWREQAELLAAGRHDEHRTRFGA